VGRVGVALFAAAGPARRHTRRVLAGSSGRCVSVASEVRATDAIVEALARWAVPPDPADPAVRLLSALIADVDEYGVPADLRGDDADQWRSSASMTPST